MNLLDRTRAYARVFRRPGEMPDLFRLLARRPAIAAGVGAYETGLMASGRVDSRLKALASIKTGSLIGCPY